MQDIAHTEKWDGSMQFLSPASLGAILQWIVDRQEIPWYSTSLTLVAAGDAA
jgi:hypothetical protein